MKRLKEVKSLLLFVVCFILLLFFGIAPSHSSNYSSPEKAFTAFVDAIQTKNVDKAFTLDFHQQKATSGKFKHEIAEMKTRYAKSFEGNPSICPATYGAVPCNEIKYRNIVTDIRLLIPNGSRYKLLEIVYADADKSVARILTKIQYTEQNHPVFADNLIAVQVYRGGITPIPPAFSGFGILATDNTLLSVKQCGSNNKFPFRFNRKEIAEALLEIRARKTGNSWLISNLKYNKEKLFSKYEQRKNRIMKNVRQYTKRVSGKSLREGEESTAYLMLEAKRGNVFFDHKDHGLLFACDNCHHEKQKDRSVSCSGVNCHGPDSDPKRVDALHANCIGCHNECEKGPIKCVHCHY